jgi:hypothetical protein
MPEQQPKRAISEVKPPELRTIVGDIQKLLWWDMSTEREYWNNEKQLSLDTLDHIAGVFQDHGLAPIDTPIVTGLKSVDEFTRHMAENFSLPDTRDDDAREFEA